MYKRRARILFLDPGSGRCARLARDWARELGAEWIEPGAAALGGSGGEAPGDPCPAWSTMDPAGWDLVVVLGRGPAGIPVTGVRHKRWDLEGACPPPDGGEGELPEACRALLRDRVEGLLGGFRMKAREDASEASE